MSGTEPPQRFLQTLSGRRAEKVIRRFHHWLDAKGIVVAAADPVDIERFFHIPFRKLVTARTAQVYKNDLIKYLSWLYERRMLSFDPKQLGIRMRRPLPALAVSFVRSFEPTHRASTCHGYRSTLVQFHEWLHDAHVRLRLVTRAQMEQWFLSLNDRGLHPSTRIHMIQHVRAYLRWLGERGELRRDTDELIRGSDLPKLPSYLPRPLPPDIDRELQARLGRSLHPWWQGLLLMRRTGLRIGELRMLAYDCIRQDPGGNPFLKVPLGKLNSERLVPLSPESCQVIHCLQQFGNLQRRYLLERHDGSMAPYLELTRELRAASEGLHTPEPITSHRLRHTYATSLLNAGMSLVSVMKLLGHRDYRMTLRYTAITQETVSKEYFDALGQLEARYTALRSTPRPDTFDPDKALNDVARWLNEARGDDAKLIVKRIVRLRESIANPKKSRPPPRKD